MTTAEEKYTLITRDLQEVLDGDIVQKILAEGKLPKCYWGGCHCAYSQIHQTNLLAQALRQLGGVRRVTTDVSDWRC